MKLAVIADDLTGALDTGVKFTGGRAAVRVCVGAPPTLQPGQDPDVLVVDAELRHMSPEQAYRACFKTVRAVLDAGAERLYIKVDSALRGNIGPMMQAALDGSGADFAAFAPALPQMGRVTRGGVHYVGRRPITESVFGRDPFEPVRSPRLADLFAGCPAGVQLYAPGQALQPAAGGPAIGIFDIEAEGDFDRLIAQLQAAGRFRVLGGCAGFAAHLPRALGLAGGPEPPALIPRPLLVLCGSLNPITKAQLDYGEQRGAVRLSLDSRRLGGPGQEELLRQVEGWMAQRRDILIDTTGPGQAEDGQTVSSQRGTVAQALGALMFRLLHSGRIADYQPMIIGGDTLMGLMAQLPAAELVPLAEPVPGAVLSRVILEDGAARAILTKSGGFGSRELLDEIHQVLNGGMEDGTVCAHHPTAGVQRPRGDAGPGRPGRRA